MKTCRILIILSCILFAVPQSHAQLLKKLGKKLEKKLERKVEQKIDKESDKAIDGVLDPKEERRRKRKARSSKGSAEAEMTDEEAEAMAMEQINKMLGGGNSTPLTKTYTFPYETITKITTSETKETYTMSFLINPDATYSAMKMDMKDYDTKQSGISYIVMDGEDVHILVSSQGMKMRMSQNIAGQGMPNMQKELENYDLTKVQKTGNTKTIMGYTCLEWKYSDQESTVLMYEAPELNIPNWFERGEMPSAYPVKGHIMAYHMTSKEGTMTSEVIKINKNAHVSIDASEYKSMF